MTAIVERVTPPIRFPEASHGPPLAKTEQRRSGHARSWCAPSVNLATLTAKNNELRRRPPGNREISHWYDSCNIDAVTMLDSCAWA